MNHLYHSITRSLLLLAFVATFTAADARGPRATIDTPEPVRLYDADTVDEMPVFPGGDAAMVRFINATRHYPEQAYRDRIEGRVLCSFIVKTDGSVDEVRVVRGVAPELDREAVRIISAMPRWKAARHDGNIVNVVMFLPIHFRR